MVEQAAERERIKKNRKVLLGIFGIPVLVIGLSSLLYFMVTSNVIKLDTVNNGELITPPLKFDELPFMTMDGKAFDYSQPEPKWAFVVFGDQFCAGDCEKMLYIARQSIVAMAKKMNRIRLIYVTTAYNIESSFYERIKSEYVGMDVLTISKSELDGLFHSAAVSPLQDRSFFVVDEHGWMMMTYQVPDTEQETLNTLGKAVIRDMKRLIK